MMVRSQYDRLLAPFIGPHELSGGKYMSLHDALQNTFQYTTCTTFSVFLQVLLRSPAPVATESSNAWPHSVRRSLTRMP